MKPLAAGFVVSGIKTLGAFMEEIRGGGFFRVGLFRGVSADVGAGILLLSGGEDGEDDNPMARIVGIASLKDAECLGFEEDDTCEVGREVTLKAGGGDRSRIGIGWIGFGSVRSTGGAAALGDDIERPFGFSFKLIFIGAELEVESGSRLFIGAVWLLVG